MAVYLPVDLLAQLRRTARSREMTYAEVLVESAAAHLQDMGERFREPVPEASSAMPSRPVRRRPSPGVQVQLRLDGRQVAWLDEQVETLGAPSRTALIVALLSAHLGGAAQE